MKMEPRDIEYFAVIAEHGNLGRAADQLGLSQPALSKGLRRLEKAVGAKLVRRTPKGVDLTAVGTALLSRARGLRLTLDDIAREAADLSEGRTGHLRVGTTPGLSGYLLPATCAVMLKEAPRVAVNVIVGTSEFLEPALSRGELDLIVTPAPAVERNHLAREHVFDREFVVIASARHRLARKKQVTLADLARERWVMSPGSRAQEALSRAFAQSKLPPLSIAVETASLPFSLSLLPSTDLLGFGPRQYVREHSSPVRLVELPVKGLSRQQSVAVQYRKDAYLSPTAQRFIKILKSTGKEIARES